MSKFLLFYLFIYGGANGYCALRLWPLARRWSGLAGAAATVLWIAFMVAGPILVRMMERAGWMRPAYLLALVSYVWMALALWFCVLSFARWICGTWGSA